MIQIRVNGMKNHVKGPVIYNVYSIFVDGELMCTTRDDELGFELMKAKVKIEALKWWHELYHASRKQEVKPIRWG